ncbi:hypothetical protein [Allorhizocola rhizosphaerae]|uniref:hypothetical protein n=1 Tax=Allorhizocola rhizosphaerae TaxID=1872709 RepID=UPI0013C2E0F3|nr:hypothetical protein [Allorhizocola rhizosphaerae]
MTAIWWTQQGGLAQRYIFVMIPTSATGIILIFGGFLGTLQASVEGVAKLAGIVASQEERITALEATVVQVVEFMAKREGYAEGFVDAAVAQEASGFGSVHRLRSAGGGPQMPGN